jgi:hypothetical protein
MVKSSKKFCNSIWYGAKFEPAGKSVIPDKSVANMGAKDSDVVKDTIGSI